MIKNKVSATVSHISKIKKPVKRKQQRNSKPDFDMIVNKVYATVLHVS